MKKVRLLIVSANLAQAGNERWIYEVCKSINKQAFEVGVLSDKKYLETEAIQNFSNYYYHALKKLGVQVYEFLDTRPKSSSFSRLVNRARRLARHLVGKPKSHIDHSIISLLQKSDVICVIDFYNYATLKDVIHKYCEGRFFIVLHSHKIQFDYDPYVWFEKDLNYRFTYACPKQVEEIGSSGLSLKENSFFFNPLILDLSNYPNLFSPILNDTVIFSVFTRIARTKPIDVFIEAFAKIHSQLPINSVLHVYGEIQDKNYHQELIEAISDSGIGPNSVIFWGHSGDMAESIRNDKVNVYWGHAMNASCGYASIEVGAMGVPCIFWNNDSMTDYKSILEQTNNTMLVHNRIEDFVADNLRYVSDQELLCELSAKQRKFLTERHDISERIKDFETYVASIASSGGQGQGNRDT